MRKPHRKHWYRIWFGECPVCGSNKGYRERVYGRKPKDKSKRYCYMPDTHTYDHCIERESIGMM